MFVSNLDEILLFKAIRQPRPFTLFNFLRILQKKSILQILRSQEYLENFISTHELKTHL